MRELRQISKKLAVSAFITVSGLFFHSCSDSNVSGAGSSAYANPDSIQFTKDNYAYMLKYTYENFEASAPRSDLDAINNAANDTDAKAAYEKGIDTFVDSGASKHRWTEYFRTINNVGNDSTDPAQAYTRYPENLWAYVLLSGKPMSELLLAQYAISDTGAQVAQTYTNGPPTTVQAGYMTMKAFLEVHMNQFMFKITRETLDFNLCDAAPYTKVALNTWDTSTVNTKYTTSGGIQCISCHTFMNPVRGAWHNFDGTQGTNFPYQDGRTRGSQQYKEETNGFTLEPNKGGSVLSEADSENYYKLTPTGATLHTPRDLAMELTKNDRFSRCMVERFFSVIFGLPEGHGGQNYVPPDNYSSNDAQVKYLDQWTDTFNQGGQKFTDFFKTILKDKSYLIISYNPDGN